MEDLSFEDLLKINCFESDELQRQEAAKLLEWRYCCEIHCDNMDPSVVFAHHARGCTIVAAKLSKNVVIYQNVTIGTNMRYNKISEAWENIGTPIIAENVIIADGAKVLGPITIGKNSVIGAGAIITKDIPADSIAYGVNQVRPRDPSYDLIYRRDMVSPDEIMKINQKRVIEFERNQ